MEQELKPLQNKKLALIQDQTCFFLLLIIIFFFFNILKFWYKKQQKNKSVYQFFTVMTMSTTGVELRPHCQWEDPVGDVDRDGLSVYPCV